TTENGLSDACKPVTFIFARGTNEDGNVGRIAGPPLFSELRSTLTTANIAVQGVTYSATIAGYLSGGDAAGSTEMARLINLASTKCPSTEIVIGGYSQGAQLVHNSAKKLTAAVTAKIVAVVVFGDPYRGQAVGTVPTAKVLSICHDQDIICTGSGGFLTHLTYGIDAVTAATFI
ncbi:cutinase, partial [Calycina marina]